MAYQSASQGCILKTHLQHLVGHQYSDRSPHLVVHSSYQPASGSNLFGSSTPFGDPSTPAFGSTASPTFGSTSGGFGATTTSVFFSFAAFLNFLGKMVASVLLPS